MLKIIKVHNDFGYLLIVIPYGNIPNRKASFSFKI